MPIPFSRCLTHVLALLVTIMMAGCASTPPPVAVTPQWQPPLQAIDGVVSPALRNFLRSTAAPKVVLRVPNVASSIVAADTAHNPNYDAVYGRFERKLVEAGFEVRDRALLQSLMTGGMADYAAIGRKVDTDLIIEVTSLGFDAEKQLAEVGIDAAGHAYKGKPTLSSPLATMGVRVIQVSTGAVGGLLTLKVAAHEIGEPGIVMRSKAACFSHQRLGDSCLHVADNKGSWFGGYAWAPETGLRITPEFRVYIGVPHVLAADRLAKLLIDRLRGDL